MIQALNSMQFNVHVAGRMRRAEWNEMDGLTIKGLDEDEAKAVLIMLQNLQAEHVQQLKQPRQQAAPPAPQQSPAQPQPAPATPPAPTPPPTPEPAPAPESEPAKAEAPAPRPELEPEDNEGPAAEAEPWPVEGETWCGEKIAAAKLIEGSDGVEYAKLVLENGDKVKVVRGTVGFEEAGRISATPQPKPDEPEKEPEDEPETRPDVPAEDPVVEGVDLVPPENVRTSSKASATIKWLIDNGVRDEDELIRICSAYKDAGVCKGLDHVRDMRRRVVATLQSMGLKD